MRKVVSLFQLTLLTVGLLVGATGTASAVAVNFFHSPGDNGSFVSDPLAIGPGAFTLNLWATPSVGVYAMNPMLFTGVGGMTILTCTASTNVTCGAATATTQLLSWAIPAGGSPAGVPIELATIGISSLGTGTFSFTSGAGTDIANSTDITIDPNNAILISTVIPEPGTLLLLGTGLTGLVLQGSGRRKN